MRLRLKRSGETHLKWRKRILKIDEMKMKTYKARMNSKLQNRKLTDWRSTNDEEWMKNSEERRRTFTELIVETSRKRYGSASTLIFSFLLLLTNFKWLRSTRRAEPLSPSLLPLFIGKLGRSLPPSSPRRARLLPSEATAFWRKYLEGPSGSGCYLHPFFY